MNARIPIIAVIILLVIGLTASSVRTVPAGHVGIQDFFGNVKDATLKVAESPNAKIVIIGSGKDGLPVILGGDTLSTPTSR